MSGGAGTAAGTSVDCPGPFRQSRSDHQHMHGCILHTSSCCPVHSGIGSLSRSASCQHVRMLYPRVKRSRRLHRITTRTNRNHFRLLHPYQ
jgi:hypothetical protein